MQWWQRMLKPVFACLPALLLLLGTAVPAAAQEFRLAVMQAQKGAAAKYKPLEAYLAKKGIRTQIVAPESYTAAAQMFADGKVDGMFSGSGVAGILLLKKVAFPVVRPVGKNGTSTYWAVVVAPKGAPRFEGGTAYFKGKRVALCALASSGEFYLRSIPGAAQAAQVRIVESHGAALDAVKNGQADIAIVKNLVWNDVRARYGELEQVGNDFGQNPNDALMVSSRSDRQYVKKLIDALVDLKSDSSPEAVAAREGLGIMGYIMTNPGDFSHTLELLAKAGVGPDYDLK
jgi:ABC-type phosphate/phosphonate transport system substrate-binding protein